MPRVLRINGAVYELPTTTSSSPSVLLVGAPKSGTSLLTLIFRHASAAAGVCHLDLHGHLFAAGIELTKQVDEQLGDVLEPKGYCYGAFRHPFKLLSSARTEGPTFWIRRDPKDVIVSRYFSDAFSHPVPGGDRREAFLARRRQILELGIDDFALREIADHIALVQRFLDVVPPRNLHVFWYEDVIYAKRQWIEAMMELCGWTLPAPDLEAILRQVDVIPSAEDSQEFVRQVHPGNHLKHLAPTTIAEIDRRIAEEIPSWVRPV